MPRFVLLWTDVALWLLWGALLAYGWVVRHDDNLRARWQRVFRDPAALAASVLLGLCLVVTLLDSVHYRPRLPPVPGQAVGSAPAYDVRVRSLLDTWMWDRVESREATYSRPLAVQQWAKQTITLDGHLVRLAPRLLHAGLHIKDPLTEHWPDLRKRYLAGVVLGLAMAALATLALVALIAWRRHEALRAVWRRIWLRDDLIPWHAALNMVWALALLGGVALTLSGPYHLFGTDATGQDVFYQAVKSIRTAFVMATIATLATLPLAVVLGIAAGYLRGWVDEAVQYLYTVLSSIPSVLLIAALVLMIQTWLDKHPDFFETGAQRTDMKLFLLCVVLGLTGWTGLARLLRGETMKLRELEYVQAAQAFGVSPWRVMARHILPNVVHLVLIVTAIDFSSIILYEAVLTYVGVGVDPTMSSFGGMINLARGEMARNPVIWWSFGAAFLIMVALVLAANLFADGVRDAFDPKARSFYKPRRLRIGGRP